MSSTASSDQSRIPTSVWILGFVSLLTDVSSGVTKALVPLFLVTVLQAEALSLGIIEGIAESTASVVRIFSGTLSDRLGRRKTLAVAGYGISALSKPLFALATSPLWILMARFSDRLGKGIRGAPRDALVADVTPEHKRGAAFGLRQSLDTIGEFTGPLIAFLLMAASNDNFRLVFWFTAIPSTLGVALLIIGIREPKRNQAPSPSRKSPLQWQELQRLSKPYWILVGSIFLFSLGNSSDAFLLLRAEQAGISTSMVPLTLLVMNLAYFFSAYPMGALSDRISRLGLLITGLVIYGIIYLGFALAPTPLWIWGLFVFYGAYLGTVKGVLPALMTDQVPEDLRGTAFGFLNMAVGGALLPASILAGALWQGIGSGATFFAGSLFAWTAAVCLMINRKQFPRRESLIAR